MDKKKIFALFGKSAAGKDCIQKWIVSNLPQAKGIVSCTTRPKRNYELNDIDYHFLTNEEFAEKVINFTMLEATQFREWFYGTPIEELSNDKINVGVFNIEGIKQLLEDSRLEVYPIYVAAADKTRLIRSLQREIHPNCGEICRRYFADEEDFKNLDFNFEVINNDEAFPEDRIKWLWSRLLNP